MSSINQQPLTLNMTSESLPAQVKTARKRSREIFGKEIKCKYCSYEHSYISLQEGRYYVVCDQCQQTYLLKEQKLSTGQSIPSMV